MTMMVWDDECLVGVEEIDSQHKDFVRLVQRLQIVDQNKGPRLWKSRLLLELTKYLEYHFASEENLMLMAQYPQLEWHQFDHQRLVRVMGAKAKAFEDGEATIDSIVKVFEEWFCRHTREVDKPAAEHIGKVARDKGCA